MVPRNPAPEKRPARKRRLGLDVGKRPTVTMSREQCVTSSAAQTSFHQTRLFHDLLANVAARPLWSSECAVCDQSFSARESDSVSSGASDGVGIDLALFAAATSASSWRSSDSASLRMEDTRSLTAGLTPDVALLEQPARSQRRIASRPLRSHPSWKLGEFSVGDWSCVTAVSAIARSIIVTPADVAVLRPGRESALSTRLVLAQDWPKSVDKPAGPSPAHNSVLWTGNSMIRAPGISVAWRATTVGSLEEGGRGARRISRAKRCSSGDGTDRREIGDPGGVVIGAAGPWL